MTYGTKAPGLAPVNSQLQGGWGATLSRSGKAGAVPASSWVPRKAGVGGLQRPFRSTCCKTRSQWEGTSGRLPAGLRNSVGSSTEQLGDLVRES